MFEPTPEQQAVIEADLVPQRVVACAGSGKTTTAVHRLAEIRRRMGTSRGYAALLSFSNVAVDTFRRQFDELLRRSPELSSRVYIATVDSFITTHILRPHAHTTMESTRQAFLVNGMEPFLSAKSYCVWNDKQSRPVEPHKIGVSWSADDFAFFDCSTPGVRNPLPRNLAAAAVHNLGRTGAYTYETGRYWALLTFGTQPRLLEALAKRYPYIIVDEAQDVGSMHELLLRALQQVGSVLTLVGDPNQSIYEFADADGRFLQNFDVGPSGRLHELTKNHRSVQSIVDIANALCKTAYHSTRAAPKRKHGAYIVKYNSNEYNKVVDVFASLLAVEGYSVAESRILCRGTQLTNEIQGVPADSGRGSTRLFAIAAISRDRDGDMAGAMQLAVSAVVRLLDGPDHLRTTIMDPSDTGMERALRRLIWSFVRSSKRGLPSAVEKAKSSWHPQLKARLDSFLSLVTETTRLNPRETWTRNVTAAKLTDVPLWRHDLAHQADVRPGATTVHKAKGESIPAVLFVAKRDNVRDLLAGPSSEEARIAYVAITRPTDLLVLAVPSDTKPVTMAQLYGLGFQPLV